MSIQLTRPGALQRRWRWHPNGQQHWSIEVVARNNLLDDETHSNGATRLRGSHLLGLQELVAMELAFGVTSRQLLLPIHYASKFEALNHAGLSLSEALLWVRDDELRARPRLVGHQLLLSCQITVAVGKGFWTRAAIKQVGEQVPFVVKRTKSALLLLHGLHLQNN